MRLLFFSIFLFIIPHCVWADVFKSTDEQGNAVYSDTPLNDQAERITLPTEEQSETNEPPQNISEQTPNQESQSEVMSLDQKKPYSKFTITTPADQATIQNQPIIYVDVSVVPELQKGDTIQIYLDGHPWGSPLASTHFQFTRPDRGTHQLSAKLIDDKKGVVKETGVHTIYIHQAHIPTSPPAFNSR